MPTGIKWKAYPVLFAILFMLSSIHGTVLGAGNEIEKEGFGLKEGLDYPIPDRDKGEFFGMGRIDSIDLESGAIAIDDANYILLPSTEYYTSVMGAGSIHLFREGLAAGFIADRKGEIQSIWLIE